MYKDNNENPSADPLIRESERRLIQKELFLLEDQKVAAEQRFRTMFENALVGLFRGSVVGLKLTDANYEAARIFGFENVEELIYWVNRDFEAFAYFRDIPSPEKLNSGEPYSFSSKTWRRDGSEFWAQYSIRYTGEGRYLEGAVKDITDQVESMDRLRLAKGEAEEANDAKSRFLATMSHEIRTPLNGIIGFAEILQERNDPKAREYSRKILDESDRLMILINQLLDFSKLEANKITLESIPLDLTQILDEVEASFRKTIVMNGLSYIREMDPDLPRWYIGDPMRLRQVISNLLSNALKFTKEGGIILRVEQLDDSVGVLTIRFSVIDTGIGIPREKQKLIFSSFVQADTSTSRQYGGTGLGISICRELVELMGGDLGVESTVGKGSKFVFSIPMTLCPDTRDTVPAHLETRISRFENLSGKKVLIVEDYETNREIARHHLEKVGSEVFFAENGREALDFMAESVKVDLVFMDMHMPLMDGLEATRRIREAGINTPIIGMTASAYAEDRVSCLDAGMDDYLSKPLRRAQMLTKAVDWVESGDLARKNQSPEVDNSVSVTGTSPLRYNDFLEELDGAEDLARELLDGFTEDSRKRLKRVEAAMESGDFHLLHREAHSIKGGAMNVMADELAGKAFALESLARENESESVLRKVFSDLTRAFNRYIEAWKELQQNDETEKRQPGSL